MEESTPQGQCDPVDIKTIFESLYDTFVKYLNPEVIINHSFLFGAQKDYFLQNQSSRDTAVQNLIGWILDDDNDFEKAISHFIVVLRELTPEHGTLHPAISGGTDDEKLQISDCMKHIICILDGSLLKQLSAEDMNLVLDRMLKNKIISEKIYQQAKTCENPQKCCVKMLENIKKGKPDWPFTFFRVMKEDKLLLGYQQQNEIFEVVSAMPLNSTSETEKNPTDLPAHADPELQDAWDNYSTFSHSSTSSELVYIPENIMKSPEFQMLIDMKNIDRNRITCDLSAKEVHRRQQLLNAFSDDDDEDPKSNNEDSEETPHLNLRNYQVELAENAIKGRNTIICAPTGSGKTRVATHIILNHLEKKKGNEERKIAFLARTVPLVMQQCKSLKKYLPKKFEVTSLTGDSEDSMHLHMILPDNDVIVMTPRILENHLKKKCFPHLGVFSMLIFDECHHTRKGEPYNTLMFSYLKTKKQINEAEEGDEIKNIKLPQIVGLTASISVEKSVQDEEAVKYILQVCGNLDADSISCVEKNEEELKRTVPVPKEELIKLREVENDEAANKIVGIMKKLEKAVIYHADEIKHDDLSALLKKMPNDRKSQQYGQWTVKIKNVAKSFPRKENRETISSVRALIIIADYLSAFNVALELLDLVLLEHVLAYLKKCFDKFKRNEHRTSSEDCYFNYFLELEDIMKGRLRTENPNLTRLKEVLINNLTGDGDKSCGIIFVRTRALTEALTSWLKDCGNEKLQNLKACIFTGTGAAVEDGGMTTTEQDEVIERFRSGETRLLVATSVAEEGIDIPECNLVIKYNHVGNEVTTVQTRGRSRKEGGKSILLAMDKIIRKERINQEKAKMMERAIRQIKQMKRSKIRRLNSVHQQQILKDEEIFQIVKQQEESILSRKKFKMVCHLCRKVIIDCEDIRTIFQTHHVVVNRDILSQTKTIPYKGAKYVDELRMIGSVRCMGEPEEGKRCYNKLGSMMVYSKIPFVVLGIKNFGFDSNEPLGLEFYNQWKKVPYLIDEIGPSDFQRYLPEKKVVEEIVDDSDTDDEDSDNNSGGDDDNDDNKGKNTPIIDNEPARSDIRDSAGVPVSNDSSATERIHVMSAQGGHNSDEFNTTHPKRFRETSDKNNDSGFCGGGIENESADSSQSTTALKGAAPVIRHEGPPSVQPSAISSFKSDEKLHQTKPMSLSKVVKSELRIQNFRLRKHTEKILNDAPELKSSFSSGLPPMVVEECLPSAECSIESNSSVSDSVAEENRNSSDSNDSTVPVSDSAAEENRNSSDSNVPVSDSAAEENRNSSDSNDSTVPKEMMERNVEGENSRSQQNDSDGVRSHSGQPNSSIFNLL